MKLFLIRHGETVDNVAGNYAGITDSALTSHGIVQARRLGMHLSSMPITHFFSSDLQRAFLTSEAICEAQATPIAKTVKVAELREQDFGPWEGKKFATRKEGEATGLVVGEVESKDSMRKRAEDFIDKYLLSLMGKDDTVVLVSHGIFLSHLWRSLLRRFDMKDVVVTSGLVDGGFRLEYLGGWSNTGYLELDIESKPASQKLLSNDEVSFALKFDTVHKVLSKDEASLCTVEPSPSVLSIPAPLKKLTMTLQVKAVNSLAHLKGLKRTRGIGSAKHDTQQSTIESFFKRQKFN